MVYIKKGRAKVHAFFDDQKLADKATIMLKEGISFNKIAVAMGCGNETVGKFFRKLIDSGVVINRPAKYIFHKEKKPQTNSTKIKKYSDYLKIENDKLKEIRRQRKEEARKNVERAKKNRKKEQDSVIYTGEITDID